MNDNTDKKPDEAKENKNTEQPKTEDTIKGILGLILIYFAWTFFSSEGSVSTTPESKTTSTVAANICQQLVDATNAAFSISEPYGRNATILKLKSVKATVEHDWDDSVSCKLFIKNEGKFTIQAMSGYIYYFDADNVADKKMFFTDTIIHPQETIKTDIRYLPKNMTRMEIRDNEGNVGLQYQYN